MKKFEVETKFLSNSMKVFVLSLPKSSEDFSELFCTCAIYFWIEKFQKIFEGRRRNLKPPELLHSSVLSNEMSIGQIK